MPPNPQPDLSIPDIPAAPLPPQNAQGQFVGKVDVWLDVDFNVLTSFIGPVLCQAMFPNAQPPVPYGEQTRENSLTVESGFKVSPSLIVIVRAHRFDSRFEVT